MYRVTEIPYNANLICSYCRIEDNSVVHIGSIDSYNWRITKDDFCLEKLDGSLIYFGSCTDLRAYGGKTYFEITGEIDIYNDIPTQVYSTSDAIFFYCENAFKDNEECVLILRLDRNL